MSRLIALALLLSGVAGAEPAPPVAEAPEDDLGDQAISAQLGLAAGGRMTPGGLRLSGHYLYQLSGRDWFDGGAHFTFGSGEAGCFRDRDNAVICDHGATSGSGVEVVAGVRRMLRAQGGFRPYARLGIGLGIARYGDDDISGFTVALHAGAGLRVTVAPSIAVVAEADLGLGYGSFNHELGNAPYTGLAVGAGVEFRLR